MTCGTRLGSKILEQLAPLISELRKSGEDVRVTNQEKERAREVAEELEKVFTELDEEAKVETASSTNGRGPESGPAGRKRPEARQPRPPVQNPRGPNTNPRQPRTPPPEDPAGSLARILEKVTGGSTRPPIRIRGWGDGVERSAWTTEGAKVFLDINKSYPLYKYLQGAKPYLAETAILLLCGPNEGEPLSASQYVDRVNLMLLRWARVADQSVSG